MYLVSYKDSTELFNFEDTARAFIKTLQANKIFAVLTYLGE